ncbi:SpoIIE family protein phosphatase [Streptomyces sp. NPDC051776]|uniref:SpoIIE family protein phosphatase n=1 Tax=Streptomyces sp. NPDC051776 TaxID=3155414 RepID=UPI00343B29E1
MSMWNASNSADDFRGPLDVTRAATAVLDAQDVIIGWSPAAEDLLGYTAEEIIGHRVTTLLVGRPTPEPTFPGIVQPAAGPLPPSEPRIARHRDGHVLQVATTVCELENGGSGPARVLVAADLEMLRHWESHQAMRQGLATQSPIALCIYDRELRVAWANAKYEEEIGVPLEAFSGRHIEELYPAGEFLTKTYPVTLAEVMRYVLATGEPVVDLHYHGHPPADPENEHFWSCSYYRLQDARGHVLGVCEEAFDITDRYRTQQRLELLVRAGGSIGTTLDMELIAREITDVVVPRFADTVTVDLVDVVLEGEEPDPARDAPASLLRMARRSRAEDTEGADLEKEKEGEQVAGSPVGMEDPMRTEQASHSGQGAKDTADGKDTDDAGYSTAGGTADVERTPQSISYPPASPQGRSLSSGRTILEEGTLVIPLRARGATMGLVTFLRTENLAPFDSGELALADELVARTAVSLDNARRYTRERAAALTLQHSLLPRHLPPQSALDVAYRYLPTDSRAGVGGDWFDVIALSGTRVGLVVGDVVGHGLNAAATMGRLRTTVRALARMDLAPDELLFRLDDLVGQSAEQGAAAHAKGHPGLEEDVATGVTCLYAVYDPVSRLCTMARAGHLPPVIVAPDGTRSVPDLPPGPPLGLGGLPFESLEIELPEGSLLSLFTDGLVGSRTRDLDVGLEKLSGVLAEPGHSLDETCDRVLAELLPGGPAADDAALLLVRTRRMGADQVAVWELPPEPAGVAKARDLAAGRLREWGLEELAFTTELVVSELVTNAIRHAAPPVQLRLIRDRTLLCEVSDGGHTSPHLRHSASDDEGGRGLFIVAQIVRRWGTRYTPSGKTIWTEQAFPDSDTLPYSVP